ncbi:MAG: hypothetical protein QXK74_07540 [Candidatus Nitrosocaldaceae archaeon]
MFFLGHMVWAYLFSRPLSNHLNIHLIMLLGILPDIDILFNSIIIHRSITHSIPILTLTFIPFFIKYRYRALPYYIALTQHIFFGDLIVGKTQLLWPFGPTIGLGFKLTSIESIFIEGLGLVVFIILLIKDKALFSLEKRNILMIIPLIPLLIFPLTFTAYSIEHSLVNNFAKNIVKDDIASLVSILHILLAIVLIIMVSNGIRAHIKVSKYREK